MHTKYKDRVVADMHFLGPSASSNGQIYIIYSLETARFIQNLCIIIIECLFYLHGVECVLVITLTMAQSKDLEIPGHFSNLLVTVSKHKCHSECKLLNVDNCVQKDRFV